MGTTVFYESVHRLNGSLKDLLSVVGGERPVVLAKELTKKFETFINGSVGELLLWIERSPDKYKGEFVVLISGATSVKKEYDQVVSELTLDEVLTTLLKTLSLKQAVMVACELMKKKKNEVYPRALELKEV